MYYSPNAYKLAFAQLDFFSKLHARNEQSLVYYSLPMYKACLVKDPAYVEELLLRKKELLQKDPVTQVLQTFLGKGLLNSEGKLHQQEQKLIAPLFSQAKLMSYRAQMLAAIHSCSERWEDGQALSIAEEMQKLTCKIILHTIFNLPKLDIAQEQVERLLKASYAQRKLLAHNPLLMYLYKKMAERKYLRIPFTFLSKLQRVKRNLDCAVYDLIQAEARQLRPQQSSLIAALLQSKQALSHKQIRDECVTFLMAGHETTAKALCWTWYLLAKHPEAQSKLQEEVDRILDLPKLLLETSDFKDFPYARSLFMETLRLYPPVWIISRQALVDFHLKQHFITRGTNLTFCIYAMHRDSRYFAKASDFLPERWLDDSCKNLPPFAFAPFGGGSRRCMGSNFAFVEALSIIIALAKQWDFTLLAQDEEIECLPHITLSPRRPIGLQLKKRLQPKKPKAVS